MAQFFLFALTGLVMVFATSAMYVEPYTAAETNFYDLCEKGENVRCTGAWRLSHEVEQKDCFESRNCTGALAIESDGDDFIFHLIASIDAEYVSLGFSSDIKMGDEHVAACVRNDTGIFPLSSYNEGFKNIPDESNEVITLVEASHADLILYCKFKIENTLQFAKRTADNPDSEFHIVFAAGQTDPPGGGERLGSHGTYFATEEKWPVGPKIAFESFYDLCANNKETVQCSGAWSKSEAENDACLEFKNCTKAIAMEKADDEIIFHMMATNNVQYVALGFSQDQDMGEEPVVACINSNGTITSGLSYNVGYKNVLADSNEGLQLDEAKVEDDAMYCKFRLSDTLKFARHFDNNTDESFYVVGASGSVRNGNLGHHSGHIVSSEKWSISSASSVISSLLLSIVAAAFLIKC